METIVERKRRILVIEDEPHLAEGLKLNLIMAGFECSVASDGHQGLILFREKDPDLVVLDLMLPLIDGHTVLEKIRVENEKLPVLILSAKDAIQDKVRAFKTGVDDYIKKPFDLDEFLLRIESLLKKSNWYEKGLLKNTETNPDRPIAIGQSLVNLQTGKVSNPQGEIQLTVQELKLLKIFLQRPEVPLERKELLELAWGYTQNVNTRTLDNFIVRLRKYFEVEPKNPKHFVGVRSIGYIFNP